MSEAGERGFTLFEMLVVLAVLALIGGLAWPSLAGAIATQRFRGAAISAEAGLRSAHALALRSGRTVTVGRRTLGAMPAGTSIALAPDAGIAFFPDGSSTGGTVDLAGPHGRLRYRVSPTGLVRLAAR